MKNIITAFLKTYTATKIGIIASSVVFIGVATMSTIYVMGAEKDTKQETVITSRARRDTRARRRSRRGR